MNKNYFAEIIGSSLYQWHAQAWQWDQSPLFGSLVIIEQQRKCTLFGIVHQIETGSRDATHIPYAYQKTEEELRRDQPHIFNFLKTTFIALPLGYQEQQNIWYQLPPQPPKIHTFIRYATRQEQEDFFGAEQYLHLLFSLSPHVHNLDELLFAILKQSSQLALLTKEKWRNFIDLFGLLTGNDYRRLKLFLQRAQTLITMHA